MILATLVALSEKLTLLSVSASGESMSLQSFVPGADAVLAQLTKLNSVCMPMRYLWVFASYLALRAHMDKFPSEYRFANNQAVAKFFGVWCFAITAFCCIMGMYSTDLFTMILNVVTPIVLVGLGMIMPVIAKKEQVK